MLKKRIIRKILITTVFFFILLAIYSLPVEKEDNLVDQKIKIEYVTSVNSSDIYLLNTNNFLVKAKLSLTGTDILENSKDIINNLKNVNNSKFPSNLKGLIPRNTKVNTIRYDNNVLYIDFNQELLNVDISLEEKVIESLVFSLTALDKVEGISITINNGKLEELPKSKIKIPSVITKSFGINKVYHLTTTKDIDKIVMYYVTEISDNIYYVPVTKYVNNTKDRIKVIIENLSSSYIYETSLMSYLNSNTNLLNYKIDDNKITLNFNENIFNDQNEILEEVLYSISASVFDNYNVQEVVFQVNGKDNISIKLKDVK